MYLPYFKIEILTPRSLTSLNFEQLGPGASKKSILLAQNFVRNRPPDQALHRLQIVQLFFFRSIYII